MKAVVKYGYGYRETELREVPVPTIGDEDLLIEVKAAGVCGSDIAFDDGMHENLLRPPVILGHEFAGIVAQVGKNVKSWQKGDRIVSDNTGYVCGKCHACGTANYLICPSRLGLGYGMDGGFASYVKIPGDVMRVFPNTVMHIPEQMSFEEAAIMDPASNAYKAVVQESFFLTGDFAAVFGVGPLGQFSIQALRASGAAKIIAVGMSDEPERFELAKKNGATDTIFADTENVAKKASDITKGEGVGLAVDCAGPAAVLKEAIKIVRNGGEIVKIGYDAKPLDFSLDMILDKSISIKGHYGYNFISWKNVMNLAVAGKMDLKANISHKMNISQFREAFDLVRNKKSQKIILYPE